MQNKPLDQAVEGPSHWQIYRDKKIACGGLGGFAARERNRSKRGAVSAPKFTLYLNFTVLLLNKARASYVVQVSVRTRMKFLQAVRLLFNMVGFASQNLLYC